ncbi:carbohydrate kinase [Micromonospora sp. NPDC048830]|uniref:carbohydrate kinase family protein n=1 Tax=Micromonospora sp. NPDC048830 TaxID=3364257 RepID=UPI003712C4B7
MNTPSAARFAVVGEAIVDVVTTGDGQTRELPGGSPANVAVGLARLGNAATLLTQIGADARGDLLRHHLAANGVTIHQAATAELPTSAAYTHVDPDGQPHYRFDVQWQVDTVSTPHGVTHAHVGSLGAFLEPGATAVRTWLGRAGVLASFDPNCRPALMGPPHAARRRVEELVAAAGIVKASDQDLAWLYPDTSIEDAAARWLAAGPALVVVTQGADGAYATTANATIRTGAPRVRVVDSVGAGDSFMAALADGLHRQGLLDHQALTHAVPQTLHAVLTRSAAAAAITCTRPGADPPTLAELDPFFHGTDRWAPSAADRSS